MGRYIYVSRFSPFDSNTIDDISGFKKKFSEVARRWDGVYGAPDMIEERQPQDFPVVPSKQVVFKNIRTDQVQAEGAVAPPEII